MKIGPKVILFQSLMLSHLPEFRVVCHYVRMGWRIGPCKSDGTTSGCSLGLCSVLQESFAPYSFLAKERQLAAED